MEISPSTNPDVVSQNKNEGHGQIKTEKNVTSAAKDEETPSGEDGTPITSIGQLVTILGTISLTAFFAVMDETMIATILGSISATFKSSTDLSWTTTIYIIGVSTSQPLAIHLTSLFGRVEGLVLCCFIFIIGCLVCGLAYNLPMFLAGRAVQGFGGGAMLPILTVVEGDLVPTRTRGITEAVAAVVVGVGLATGGLWGGGINDAIGWKWAFLVQVPMMVLLTVIIWITVKLPRKPYDWSAFKRIDYLGIFTLLTTVILLQVGLDSAGNTATWSSPLVLTSLPLSLASFLIFLWWDIWHAPEPVIQLRLLVKRNVAIASLVAFTQLCSYTSILFYVPIYLQVLGQSTTQSGLKFTTQAAGVTLGAGIAGLMVKWTGRYYYLNVFGQVVFVAGSALLIILDLHSPTWYTFVFLLLTGLGFGTTWITLLMGYTSSVSKTEQGNVQALSWCSRTLGMIVGLTISAAVFQTFVKSGLESRFEGLPESMQLIEEARNGFVHLYELDPTAKVLAQESYMEALRIVFYSTTAEMSFSALLSFFISENKLPDHL